MLTSMLGQMPQAAPQTTVLGVLSRGPHICSGEQRCGTQKLDKQCAITYSICPFVEHTVGPLCSVPSHKQLHRLPLQLQNCFPEHNHGQAYTFGAHPQHRRPDRARPPPALQRPRQPLPARRPPVGARLQRLPGRAPQPAPPVLRPRRWTVSSLHTKKTEITPVLTWAGLTNPN